MFFWDTTHKIKQKTLRLKDMLKHPFVFVSFLTIFFLLFLGKTFVACSPLIWLCFINDTWRFGDSWLVKSNQLTWASCAIRTKLNNLTNIKMQGENPRWIFSISVLRFFSKWQEKFEILMWKKKVFFFHLFFTNKNRIELSLSSFLEFVMKASLRLSIYFISRCWNKKKMQTKGDAGCGRERSVNEFRTLLTTNSIWTH